jgi:hypothetical protein
MIDVAAPQLPRTAPEYCVTCEAPLRAVIIASERRHHANYFCGHAQWFDPLPPELAQVRGLRCSTCGEIIPGTEGMTARGSDCAGPRKCEPCLIRKRATEKARLLAKERRYAKRRKEIREMKKARGR